MKEVIENLNLEPKHYTTRKMEIPVVDAGLYNTLGRRLFDLYRKYDVTKEDQREFESLCFTLQSFLLERRQSRDFWERLKFWK